MSDKKKLVIVDGNALFGKAYGGVYGGKDGVRENGTRAVDIFFIMYKKLLERLEVTNIIFTFDAKGETFRKKIYNQYKANRDQKEQAFYNQFLMAKELVKLNKITTFEKVGYEADDIIAKLAKKAVKEDFKVEIVTGDKDLFQLINKDIEIRYLWKDYQRVNLDTFPDMFKDNKRPKFEQFLDYKALKGDKSDNIPGIRGVGPVWTVKLLDKYGNIDNILEHLDELTPSQKLKFETARDNGDLKVSRELVKIVSDFDMKEVDNAKISEISKLQKLNCDEVKKLKEFCKERYIGVSDDYLSKVTEQKNKRCDKGIER